MADLDVDFGDAKESRFSHLLKPIRDMETCFNIDIAHELREYLEQLENAQFAFEGSRHMLVDFAEAALLIQGSVCVYSKKVEYLCAFAYQALETIKGRKRQQAAVEGGDGGGQAQAGARGRGAAVARGEEENEEDSLEHFWNVAPLLKESNDLDLAEGEGLMPNAGCSMRPPAALLALEDQTQGAATSNSAKGDGDAGVYRLQQCVVHCSGALLLDPRDGDLYDQHLRCIGPQRRGQDLDLFPQLAPLTLQPPQQQPPTQAQSALHQQLPVMEQAQAQPTCNPAEPMDVEPAPPLAADVDYADDDGGGFAGGGDWPSDDEVAGALPDAAGKAEAMALDAVAAGAAGSIEDAVGEERTRAARATRAAALKVGSAAGQEGDEFGEEKALDDEEFDPYKPLDPAEKNSRLADRPLVVRKPVRRRKNPAQNCSALTGSGTVTAHAVVGLMLPEFNYFLSFLRPAHAEPEKGKAEQGKPKEEGAKVRRAAIVERVALAGPIFDAKDAAAAVAAEEAAAEEESPHERPGEVFPEQQPYGFDDNGDGGGYGGGGASDLDDDVDPGLVGPCNPGEGEPGGSWHRPGVDEADDPEGRMRLGRLGLWPGAVPPMGALVGSEDSMAVDGQEPTYEELCRAHMESMLVAATAREVQSDLARRVSSWKQRIDPVLQAEEARPAFDIQDYGERLLGRLSTLKLDETEQQPAQEAIQEQPAGGANGGDEGRPLVNFSVVAAGLQSFEVPRMFSAMLQLINNRNIMIVKIDTSNLPPGEVPDEPFRLQLLSTDMYHKTMGERLALPPPPNQAGGGAATAGAIGDDEDCENRATPTAKAKQVGGRGKAGGGAKRAKKAAVPLADANMDDD